MSGQRVNINSLLRIFFNTRATKREYRSLPKRELLAPSRPRPITQGWEGLQCLRESLENNTGP